MISKTVRICFIIWMAFIFSGCSSFLTYSAPLKSELVDGERKTGEFSRYEYTCSAVSNKIYIEKQPMCSESVMKMRHAKKELRCFTCSVLELALFGLGLIDMIWAGSIVKESETIEPLAEYDTGKLIVCGEKQVAADEPVVLQNAADGIQINLKTDALGMIDVENYLQHVTGSMALEVHLEADKSISFKYIYVSDPVPYTPMALKALNNDELQNNAEKVKTVVSDKSVKAGNPLKPETTDKKTDDSESHDVTPIPKEITPVGTPRKVYLHSLQNSFNRSICHQCHRAGDINAADKTGKQWRALIENNGHSVFKAIAWPNPEEKSNVMRYLLEHAKNTNLHSEGIGIWR